MLLWLGLAFAAPVDSLLSQAATSEALILDCEARGLSCGASATELGEAFLVRAITAAVTQGEIDSRSTANARLLAPTLAAEWRDDLDALERVGQPIALATEVQLHPTTVLGATFELSGARLGLRLRIERSAFVEVLESTRLELWQTWAVGPELVVAL